MLGAQHIVDQFHLRGGSTKDQHMPGRVPHPLLSSPQLCSLHLVDTVEEVPVVVCQLACQVLGAHQVQPLGRAHSGPQLLRVWGLQVEEYSEGSPRDPEERDQVGGKSLGETLCP